MNGRLLSGYSLTPQVEADRFLISGALCEWPWDVVATSTSANTLRYFHTAKNPRSAFAVYSPLLLTTATYRSLSGCKRRLVPDDITYRNTLHTRDCLQETYSIYYWCTVAFTHPFLQWDPRKQAQGHSVIDEMPPMDICSNIPKSINQIVSFINVAWQLCISRNSFSIFTVLTQLHLPHLDVLTVNSQSLFGRHTKSRHRIISCRC